MAGITLIFASIVLIANSLSYFDKLTNNSIVAINIFTGLLYITFDLWSCVDGISRGEGPQYFYNYLGGLMFGFSFLLDGLCQTLNWDRRNLGYFSLFVFVNSLVYCWLIFFQDGFGKVWDGVSWLVWGLLWLASYLEYNKGVELGDWFYYLTILASILTCFIPGWLMVLGMW